MFEGFAQKISNDKMNALSKTYKMGSGVASYKKQRTLLAVGRRVVHSFLKAVSTDYAAARLPLKDKEKTFKKWLFPTLMVTRNTSAQAEIRTALGPKTIGSMREDLLVAMKKDVGALLSGKNKEAAFDNSLKRVASAQAEITTALNGKTILSMREDLLVATKKDFEALLSDKNKEEALLASGKRGAAASAEIEEGIVKKNLHLVAPGQVGKRSSEHQRLMGILLTPPPAAKQPSKLDRVTPPPAAKQPSRLDLATSMATTTARVGAAGAGVLLGVGGVGALVEASTGLLSWGISFIA